MHTFAIPLPENIPTDIHFPSFCSQMEQLQQPTPSQPKTANHTFLPYNTIPNYNQPASQTFLHPLLHPSNNFVTPMHNQSFLQTLNSFIYPNTQMPVYTQQPNSQFPYIPLSQPLPPNFQLPHPTAPKSNWEADTVASVDSFDKDNEIPENRSLADEDETTQNASRSTSAANDIANTMQIANTFGMHINVDDPYFIRMRQIKEDTLREGEDTNTDDDSNGVTQPDYGL